MKVRIATRGSKLALWQAHHVRDRLIAAEAGLEVDLVVLKTQGDKIQDRALSEVGGKGLFVKEIEEALLDGRADIAVHSMKDLPAEVPAELVIAAIPEREDARDALIVRAGVSATSVATLPDQARVGTSSLRRVCQLRRLRPDLKIEALRGNVDTRLRKLDEGQYDALVLACAGLRRLGHADRISQSISPEESLPAIGQGALAIECRRNDAATLARLAPMEHAATRFAVTAERALLARLQGGCQTPIAGYAIVEGQNLWLRGLVGAPDGSQSINEERRGPTSQAESLGTALADELLAKGAAALLQAPA